MRQRKPISGMLLLLFLCVVVGRAQWLDDRNPSLTCTDGLQRIQNDQAYHRTETALRNADDWISAEASGTEITVFGKRHPGGAPLRVVLDGTFDTTVTTRSDTILHRAPLLTIPNLVCKRHHVMLSPLSEEFSESFVAFDGILFQNENLVFHEPSTLPNQSSETIESLSRKANLSAQEVLFSDDFEDGLSPAWNIETWDNKVPEWEIEQSDGSSQFRSKGNCFLYTGDLSWDNYALEFDYRTDTSDKDWGVIIRYHDIDNFVFIKFTKHGIRPYIYSSGEPKEMLDSWFGADLGYDQRYVNVRVEVTGARIGIAIDGVEYITCHYYPGRKGGVGFKMRSKPMYIDNVVVSRVNRPDEEPPPEHSDEYRTEQLLDGDWSFTPHGGSTTIVRVPDFWNYASGHKDVQIAEYERTFEITPGDDAVRLEFEAVNFKCTVSVDGTPVGNHQGGFVPFSFDIGTALDHTSNSHTVKVKVDGSPSGWPKGHGTVGSGIVQDVWVRTYPAVYVEDVFVKTSVRNQQIEFVATLVNSGSDHRTVSIRNEALHDGSVEKTFDNEGNITLAPGEIKTVSIKRPWSDPTLWWNDDPFMYTLYTSLLEDGTVIDRKSDTRFGFRELWIDGIYLYMNGVRLNLRGDSSIGHGIWTKDSDYRGAGPAPRQEFYYEWWSTRAKAEKTVDSILAMNMNLIRFHMGPPPDHVLDVCDEKGLMVVDETAMYGSSGANGNVPKENAMTWTREWVLRDRNHPSVVEWSNCNEGGCDSDRDRLIDQLDGTRPVIRGAGQTEDAKNLHYPDLPSDIYGDKHTGDIPSGLGEAWWIYGREDTVNQDHFGLFARLAYGHGHYARSFRYRDYYETRPYRFDWAWGTIHRFPERSGARKFVRKSMSPVAVFDKEYDNITWDNVLNHENFYYEVPQLLPGTSTQRNLIILNDERKEGTTIRIVWQAIMDGEIIAGDEISVDVTVGFSTGEAITFDIPPTREYAEIVLSLKAYKGDKLMYSDDSYRFRVFDESTATASPRVMHSEKQKTFTKAVRAGISAGLSEETK